MPQLPVTVASAAIAVRPLPICGYALNVNDFALISGISPRSALNASFGFTDAARIAGIIAAVAAASARNPIATPTESGSAMPVFKEQSADDSSTHQRCAGASMGP